MLIHSKIGYLENSKFEMCYIKIETRFIAIYRNASMYRIYDFDIKYFYDKNTLKSRKSHSLVQLYRKTPFLVSSIKLGKWKIYFCHIKPFYGKVLWQKFIFHVPCLISDTKNGVFRYLVDQIQNLKALFKNLLGKKIEVKVTENYKQM